MINESLKNAFKEMWKKNLNLLDISKSDLNSHIESYNPHNITASKIDAASSVHTHPYAGSLSAGGSAISAVKLDSSAGSATNPIYFSDGKPAACTYTLGKSVPSDAKFTDTVYTHPTTSGNKHIPSGGSSGQILRWSADGAAAWGSDSDTKNTAGSTDTSSKIFLVGATSQAANPQTYSHDTAYVGTDGCLYSNSKKVSVDGHTHSYLTTSDTRNDNPAPNSTSFKKNALSTDFKYANKIDSPSGFSGTYCGLINFAPWSETSGGNGYQIAVGYNANTHPRLAVRSADLSATSWGSWYKIYTSDDKPTPADIGAASSSHTHNYAGSSSAGGPADYLKTQVYNEINFKGLTDQTRVHFNYRDADTDAIATENLITGYYFNNKSGKTTGVTLYADNFSGTAEKATQDGSGNNIVNTYATKSALTTVSNLVGNTSVSSQITNAISSKADLDTSGKVLSSQLPSYVDDVLEYSAKSNFPSTGESGKIYVDTATNLTYRWSGSAYVEISQSLALGETSSTAYRGDRGKIAYDHSQTSHAPSNAEVNQNAFSNVKVGSTTVSADSKTDTLELVAGTNVTLTPDATNDKVTIATNDTKNTAGSTNTNDKIFLVGATSQAANPQTYSHDTAYVGTDGCLYSNNTKVSVNGHTHTVSNISDLTATAAELNYCDGVTSNIQTQLNNTVKLSGNQTISGNKTFNGVIIFDDPDASITPSIYTDINNSLKISVGEKLFWMNSDGQFHSSADGRFIGEKTLSTYGVTGVKGSAESSYRKGDVNITPANIGAAESSHTHSASNITAGTLGGKVVANTSAVGDLIRKQVRNITISTALPTSSDGENGDIWLVY